MADPKEEKILPDGVIDWLAPVVATLGHPERLRVLGKLLEVGRPLSIRELMQQLGLTQSVTSRRVSDLQRCGLVRKDKVGISVYVAINSTTFGKLTDLFARITDAALTVDAE